MAGSPQTLTFLFTDIEGSTPLWDASPERMSVATDEHNRILRDVILARGGNAFRVVGDSFCVAFPDAASAVVAASEAQRALSAHTWGDAPLRVRMGLHSGTVEQAVDEIFRGPTLARAARVMSAAHGGQILLTAATVALLDRAAPPGCTLRDLGDHTLRGFARAERLYQLVLDGLRSEFPPVATQEAMRTNLPASLTTFVGRADAVAQVQADARRSRMTTLIGSGGTGKTRLAIEAAQDLVATFPDGVWLVELAPIADSSLVADAIAAVLGARAEGNTPSLTVVQGTLRDKRALLVLDNCEHVVDECARVAHTLLRALPQLHLLATSREALGIEGETIFRVPSLAMPHSPGEASAAEVAASESGQLFVDRARSVDPGFVLTERNAGAVAEVCRRLDGIPLAIELAAGRLTALSVEDLARRLGDRFRLLTGGRRTALPRQRTLRALVDWSYELLARDERAVLEQLAVFSGGFSLDAAERVCAVDPPGAAPVLDAVEHLVEKSLVIADAQRETETRFRLLETIRQYASEKLVEGGEADRARRRHFDCFLDLAQRADAALQGPLALEWLDRLEADHDNLRAALDWSFDAAPRDHARLAGALRRFWDAHGHFLEGWTRLGGALERHAERDAARLALLLGAGTIAYRLDYTQRSDDLLQQAIELAAALGDRRSEAEALVMQALDRSWLGADAIEPLALRGHAIAEAVGDRAVEASAALILGRVARFRGRQGEARAAFLHGANLFAEAQCVLNVPLALQGAGECALEQLDLAAARDLLERSLAQHRRFGNVHDAGNALALLAHLALNEGRLQEARAHCEESVGIFRALHDPNCGAHAADVQARVLCAAGEPGAALASAESAATTFRTLGFPHSLAHALRTMARAHTALGDDDAALRALFDGLAELQRASRDFALPPLLEAIAGLHPDTPVAPALLGSAATLRERLNVPLYVYERAERDARYAAVRERHPASAFEEAFAAGRALARDDAIARALALRRA